jgi:hypothetical protein
MGESSDYLRRKFISTFGDDAFHSGWQSLLSVDPEFFDAATTLAALPFQKRTLGRRYQVLIALAANIATTPFDATAIRDYITAAWRASLPAPMILEAIELASAVGINTCYIGVPLLVEVLDEIEKEKALRTPSTSSSSDGSQEQPREEPHYKLSSADTFWNNFERLDPDFAQAFIRLTCVPETKYVYGQLKGALEPKVGRSTCVS